MARWDKLWRDEAYVARNWLDPDPHIVRLTPIMQGQRVRRVLDLGCGVGRHLLYLARQGFEVHGVDISAAGVERCRKELEQLRLRATLHVADMLHIPYPDAFFDWALSVQVIHHTTAATLRQAINHVLHKLKPGGFFFVTFPPVENASADDGQEIEPRTFQREEDGEPLLHHYVTAEEIDALMEGFRLLEKRLEPHESRDQFGQTTSKPRWNVLAQKPS
ncbi:MAG TPA: class I SAM-dependent methyltransferase [Alphaproteobacteria bacterium]|nr:class I SAM-dependent methyltransferase [Alphaproteobacteria bacterium]